MTGSPRLVQEGEPLAWGDAMHIHQKRAAAARVDSVAEPVIGGKRNYEGPWIELRDRGFDSLHVCVIAKDDRNAGAFRKLQGSIQTVFAQELPVRRCEKMADRLFQRLRADKKDCASGNLQRLEGCCAHATKRCIRATTPKLLI